MPNTGIPNQQAPFISGDGKINTTWFTFLSYLFRLMGSGRANTPFPVGSAKVALDFPSTPAGTGNDLTVTVPGAADGDLVTVGAPNACMLTDCCYTGWGSGPDTVTVRLNNYSTVAKNPPSGKFQVGVYRYQE